MANLKALRDGGTWYPAARSLPVMETLDDVMISAFSKATSSASS